MGEIQRFYWEGRQVVLHLGTDVCRTARDLMASDMFMFVVDHYCDDLLSRDSSLIQPFVLRYHDRGDWSEVAGLLRLLAEIPLDRVIGDIPVAGSFKQVAERRLLHEFTEGLYDYWRSFDRYLVLHSEPGAGDFDMRPYRSFNVSVERLAHLVRGIYRDICENITGDHPRVYRQVAAGVNVGLIAVKRPAKLPEGYDRLIGGVPFIRQVWMDPPVIIDPPMNKRTGQFQKVEENPLPGMEINPEEWLLFPARVGPLVVFVYFKKMFIGLGCALSNLFEIASDEEIERGPDAIYLFGAPPAALSRFGELPTVFHDDQENEMLVAAVPAEDRFGYFGYLKKMILTLHNAVMMNQGRMPYHGAMFRIVLRCGAAANVLIMGDTATGKSESLEAFRQLGGEEIGEIRIVADDMGSLEVVPGEGVLAYGTEIGAFVRLDDLQPGYAFDQIDRSVIMSPQKVNARIVLPVTTREDVLEGYRVDILLYANNYEEVDEHHQVIELFDSTEEALDVFREGVAMTKGTTSSTGLVRSYFANIFGPPQYREVHEHLAEDVFREVFASGASVGQIRTRLGIEGYETEGPLEAAKALLHLIKDRTGNSAG
jgi:hypothetical protein